MIIDSKIILTLLPIILIQFLLIIVCVLDWRKRINFKLLNRWGWLVLILFVNILGPVLYLTLGRDNTDD